MDTPVIGLKARTASVLLRTPHKPKVTRNLRNRRRARPKRVLVHIDLDVNVRLRVGIGGVENRLQVSASRSMIEVRARQEVEMPRLIVRSTVSPHTDPATVAVGALSVAATSAVIVLSRLQLPTRIPWLQPNDPDEVMSNAKVRASNENDTTILCVRPDSVSRAKPRRRW